MQNVEKQYLKNKQTTSPYIMPGDVSNMHNRRCRRGRKARERETAHTPWTPSCAGRVLPVAPQSARRLQKHCQSCAARPRQLAHTSNIIKESTREKKEKRMRQERVSHLKLKKGEKLSERVEVESPKMQSIMKRENKTRERNRDETRIRRR